MVVEDLVGQAEDGVGDVMAVDPIGTGASLILLAVRPTEERPTAEGMPAGVVPAPGSILFRSRVGMSPEGNSTADVVADPPGGFGRFEVVAERLRKTGAFMSVRDEPGLAGVRGPFLLVLVERMLPLDRTRKQED